MIDMPSFNFGFFVGFIIPVIIVSLPSSDVSLYRKAIEECERTLPRDQHCRVVGVPEEKPK